MKKLIYVILTTLLLLVAGYLANQHFATEPEIVVIEEEISVSSDAETPVEEITGEDVVETNPEDTADEGETFVDE